MATLLAPLFAILPGTVIAPGVLPAQIPGDPLGPVVAEALDNNLGLAQLRAASERADARTREARSRFLPSLALESRRSTSTGTINLGDAVNPAYAALNELIGDPRFPTDLDVALPRQHETRLRLTQPLFDPTAVAAYALSRHARDGQEFQRRAAARQLAAGAQSAYLNVSAARSARKTWEATLALVVESERVAGRLVDAGRATPDAVFRARADRSDVEQRLAEARETELAAARAFNQLLRRPLDRPVDDLADSLFRFEIAVTEEEAVAHALVRREELAQAGADIDAARANVRLATASFLPSVALALDYGFQGRELRLSRDEDFTVASVVLSWDVFSGGRDIARRQGAAADAERLRLRRAELEDVIRLDVRQAHGAAVVARNAIATADARRAAARRTFDLVRRRYEEGLATQLEFLDARTTLTDAELNQVITTYRYALRYVELERAAALRELAR
ncbi:MAG: TolC family protein [Gemmatimonadaceae bacterium]